LFFSGFTVLKMGLYLALIPLQIYRGPQEEKVLTSAFPECHERSSRTARFIPGLP